MSCGCPDKPTPRMYVMREKSLARKQNFISKKHALLSHHAGKKETIYFSYSSSNFMSFLQEFVRSKHEHFRIYFATTDRVISLVYAFDSAGKQAKYYLLHTDNFTEPPLSEIESKIMTYQTGKRLILNRQFDMNSTIGGETTCISFLRNEILEFIDEIECQNPLNIRAYLAAYLDKEGDYSKKMHIDFIFTQMVGGVELEFDLEDCANFETRKELRMKASDGNEPFKLFDYNNGTLCPPCKDCDDTGFPPEECGRHKKD